MKKSEFKEYLLKRLQSNTSYKLALKMVDKEQAEQISTMVEGWLSNTLNSLQPMITKLEENPDLKNEIKEEIKQNENKR